MSKIKKISLASLSCMVLLAAVIAACHPLRSGVRVDIQSALAHSYPAPTEPYPNVDTVNLSATQLKIISLTKQEYYKKPVSFDQNVLKYSQGVKEPWCANFASWIMNQAGVPFNNPNSGSWRIPGVNTLQQYFQSQKRYVTAGSYTPKVGDIAIYLDHNSHTNIVIAVNGDQMTTIGGNETGHVRIETQSFKYGVGGLSGFGELKL